MKTEFIGLCAAGKTTHIRQRGIETQKPTTPGRFSFYKALGILLVKALLYDCIETIIFLRRRQSWWLFTKLAYRVAQNHKDGFLEDCGVLQPLISFEIEYNVNLSRMPHWLLDFLPLPDQIVYIRTTPEEAQRRYMKRDGKAPPLERFNYGLVVCSWIIRKCGKPVTIIDN